MSNWSKTFVSPVWLCVAVWGLPLVAAEPFPLKDGDVWVMVGDSITAQHCHANYIEAFCYARYPTLKFCFRNAGMANDTFKGACERFSYSVAPWNPTVVSVEEGMNCQGSEGWCTVTPLTKLIKLIRDLPARPVLFSPNPMRAVDTHDKLGHRANLSNAALDETVHIIKAIAEKEKIPFADQFHGVIDVWGNNLAGKELPDYVEIHGGDGLHPGPAGHIFKAAVVLKQLNAEGFVSSADLDASGKIVEAKGCKIENVKASNGGLSFTRLDSCIASPIPDEVRSVLKFYPVVLEMSQYMLKVSGLKAEKYQLKINGKDVAAIPAKDLAAGVNLTAYPQGPIAEQGKAVLEAVRWKEGVAHNWGEIARPASAPNATPTLKQELADLIKSVEKIDEKIRAAAKPVSFNFELIPAK